MAMPAQGFYARIVLRVNWQMNAIAIELLHRFAEGGIFLQTVSDDNGIVIVYT